MVYTFSLQVLFSMHIMLICYKNNKLQSCDHNMYKQLCKENRYYDTSIITTIVTIPDSPALCILCLASK